MLEFFSHIRSVMAFMKLPKSCRTLTFYSEGQNYWPHLEGMVREVLATSDIHVTYISSNQNDPGLRLEHENYSAFEIGDGFIRNWLFENIDTDVMVMTMPDIHQYQVKRSKFDVHYVYVQHSLVSLHMVYRTGAFDFYDTIFCAGPHHEQEMRALEKARGLDEKNLIKHGYARLDSILEQANGRKQRVKLDGEPLHVLIAPSWGEGGTIESGLGKEIVKVLLSQGMRVTLRPHPQTMIFFQHQIDAIVKEHEGNPMFSNEANVAGQDSLHESDIMLSDWSGAALDYALGLGKPVLFVNVPKKVNNTEYREIELEPLEIGIRTKVGSIVEPDSIDVNAVLGIDFEQFEGLVYNRGTSDQVGAIELIRICENVATE